MWPWPLSNHSCNNYLGNRDGPEQGLAQPGCGQVSCNLLPRNVAALSFWPVPLSLPRQPQQDIPRQSSWGQLCDPGLKSQVRLGVDDSCGRNAHTEERFLAQLSWTFFPNFIAWFLSSSSPGSTSLLGRDPFPSVSGGGTFPKGWGASPFPSLLFWSPPSPSSPDTPREGGKGAAWGSRSGSGFVLGCPGLELTPAPPSSSSSWRGWQVNRSLPQFPYLQIEIILYLDRPHSCCETEWEKAVWNSSRWGESLNEWYHYYIVCYL